MASSWLKKMALVMSMVNALLLLEYTAAAAAVGPLLRMNHPSRRVIDRVNRNGPYVALVMAYSAEEIVVQSSGEFIPNSKFPWVDLSGRRYNVGSIRGMNVIYVMSGQRRLNAGITAQTLIDVFNICGIVHYGTAGSSNDSMSFGDVSIPKQVAFTGSWNWKKFDSGDGELPTLDFAQHNIPQNIKEKNLLEGVEYKGEEYFSEGKSMKEVFWFKPDSQWFRVASQLQGMKLQQCVNATYCLPQTPKVEFGLRGATQDIFVDNAEYRQFLFNKFKVSTIDEESSAFLMTALASKVPCIVIRGVSDLAGGGDGWYATSLSSLASTNALSVAAKFIQLIGKQDQEVADIRGL